MANTAVVESDLDRKIEIFMAQVEEEMRKPKPSRSEINAILADFELGIFGKLAGVFPRFMYSDHADWAALANASPYASFHKAFERSYRNIVPEISAQIKERGICEVFSKGPSPEVDKILLEELVRNGTPVTYHPVDVNKNAVENALNTIREYLNSKFGDSWSGLITLGENCTMNFKDARGKGKSCVIYSGGDIANGIGMWEDARETAGNGGIVVANAAVNSDLGDWASYWLGLYDNPQDNAMFMSGLGQTLPDLFSEKNRRKWELNFSYSPEDWNWAKRWGVYQTPAILAQLDVKDAMTVKTKDPLSGEDVEICFKPRKEGEPPVVLGISSKLRIAAFLLTVPKNFGLKQINYVTEKISYEAEGMQGIAAAAIFEVGKLPVNHVPAYDLAPKMLCA